MPTKTGKKTRAEKREENREIFRVSQCRVSQEIEDHISSVVQRGCEAGARIGFVDDILIYYIMIGIAEGLTLRGMCRGFKVYASDMLARILNDEQLSSRYARAKEFQSEAFADMNDELLLAPIDYREDGSHVELAHRKAVVDNRRWLMGKNHVRRFGDKVIVEGGDKPITYDHKHEHSVKQLSESYGERIKRLA